MNEKNPGKLKYINGIPYLTGQHVQFDPVSLSRSERVLGAWQRIFGPRWAGPMLVVALVAAVVVLGGIIDYVIVGMIRNGA